MSKASQKKLPGTLRADDLIDQIEDVQMSLDCRRLIELMTRITSEAPVVWGEKIIGFGSYSYTYESGRKGIYFLTGFAPRKQNISIYTNIYLSEEDPQMKALGKYKNGKSCLYIRRLADIRMDVLEKLLNFSTAKLKEMYP